MDSSKTSTGRLLITDVLELIAAKLRNLNTRHLAHGGHAAIQAESWSWEERSRRIASMSLALADHGGRPSMDQALAVAAAALAQVLAVDAAELADPTTGDDEAAA